METHVAQALELVGQVEQADATAARTGEAAAAAVGELSAQIAGLQAIKTDVQQMALNTTLKCSRIGETGKPLAVIAVELRTQAGHLEITAHQALTALQGLAGDAAGLDHGADGAQTGAGQVLSDAAARLKQAGAAVEADLVSLARQGEGVVEALRRAASRLDFQREIGAILDEAAAALEEMAGDETPWTDDLIEVLGPLLERIAKTYTMAQERETQRQATQHLDLNAVVEAPAAAAADDDLLF